MDIEVVSKWTMSSIKEWLDKNEVPYLKTDRKSDLVAAVIQSGIVSIVAPSTPVQPSTPDSRVQRVEPSKMKIEDLIAWLTEHEITVPAKRQKKSVYVEMVESAAAAANTADATEQNGPIKERVAPSTAPRPVRESTSISSRTGSVSIEKSRSMSPPRRRSMRRKLLDMPLLDGETKQDRDEIAGVVMPVQKSSSGQIKAAIVGAVVFLVVASYFFWLYQSLRSV